MRPRLLDLFCGAGGAAEGYHRAGFDVVGVDIAPQPRYPFEFHQWDAMELLAWHVHHVERGWPFGPGFDAIHASPPCQDYSRAMRHLATPGKYPRLIVPVRDLLTQTGRPWIIENVVGSPLPSQPTLDERYGVELCGTMFGRPLWRHRIFETSWPTAAPRGCDHSVAPVNRHRSHRSGGRSSRLAWRDAIGTPWMTHAETDEAIPPAYTEHIGRQLLAALTPA